MLTAEWQLKNFYFILVAHCNTVYLQKKEHFAQKAGSISWKLLRHYEPARVKPS